VLIDGKAIAAKVRGEVASEVAALRARGIVPALAVVLVGDDPASHVYVRNKTRACAEVGIEVLDEKRPASVSEAELLALVDQLNRDPRVDGILVQFPVPKGIDPQKVQQAISPLKDVDGLHPENAGRLWAGRPRFVPCTPLGVMRLLAESETPLSGKNAVVLGRSNLVGKPMAALLMQADCTVTICHSKTRELPEVVRRADIVVAAIGRTEMVKGDWVKVGATVIDVGMNRNPAGKLVGDVDFVEAERRAHAITPVPGGVGPMTIALLLSNTARSARQRLPASQPTPQHPL
jgi:methylenetetrahydrofolate dehydrogenase (NADP+) / methenyltetrahydrofolate cyclohydrolase